MDILFSFSVANQPKIFSPKKETDIYVRNPTCLCYPPWRSIIAYLMLVKAVDFRVECEEKTFYLGQSEMIRKP